MKEKSRFSENLIKILRNTLDLIPEKSFAEYFKAERARMCRRIQSSKFYEPLNKNVQHPILLYYPTISALWQEARRNKNDIQYILTALRPPG